MVPQDPDFKEALGLIDHGDVKRLAALVAGKPRLLRETVALEPAPPPYFENPKLLWFVAENPIRNRRLPANIAEIAGALIDAARAQKIKNLRQDLTTTLGLVATGCVPRECGVQGALLETLIGAGADPNAPLNSVAAHRELAACEALLSAGATLTGPIAAALGREDEFEKLLPGLVKEALQQALSLAAINARAGCVRLCLSAGADPNLYNPPGMHAHSTPLHQAAYLGDRETVDALLEGGAYPAFRDTLFDGTAAGWAAHAGHEALAATLRKTAG